MNGPASRAKRFALSEDDLSDAESTNRAEHLLQQRGDSLSTEDSIEEADVDVSTPPHKRTMTGASAVNHHPAAEQGEENSVRADASVKEFASLSEHIQGLSKTLILQVPAVLVACLVAFFFARGDYYL